MTTMVQKNLLSQVLRLIPGRILAALDVWSYRVARKRAERRHLRHVAAKARKGRAAAVPRNG
jgi:hypothetical protein